MTSPEMGRRSVFVLFDCVGSADGFLLSERQLGTIILIAIVSIFFAEHPTIASVIGGMIVLVIIAAVREHWHGRPF
jgi:hypothetical protein